MSGFGIELRNCRREGRDKGDQGFGKQETTSLSATETFNYILTQTIAFTSHLTTFKYAFSFLTVNQSYSITSNFTPKEAGQPVVGCKYQLEKG